MNTSFAELGLAPEVLKAVAAQGYENPTPIQAQAIPVVLAGRDVLGAAQTGTGKTAAFTLPILTRLAPKASTSVSPARHPVRALILTPTRELADQVFANVTSYSEHLPLRSTVVFGGVGMDDQVKALRAASSRAATQALAATPTLFGEIRQPQGRYLLIPCHSSERREIIPIGFMESTVIVGNANLCMPGANLFHFGVMTSRMHMAWVKYVCGRLESRYRYTSQIVYNNFPWPDLPPHLEPNKPPTPAHKAQIAIETAAQAILDARAKFPGSSLADLYDPLTMPPLLLKAHQKLDAAVDAAYALCGGGHSWNNDAERVAFLFERYLQLTSLLPAPKAKPARKRPAP